MTISLGFCFVYSAAVNEAIYTFTERVAERHDFDFKLERQHSLPHISVWQGRFPNLDSVVGALDSWTLPLRARPTPFECLATWAQKIVFLHVTNRDFFIEMQRSVRDGVKDLQIAGSADPQIFSGIEKKYAKSFSETGYPFAEDPYGAALPHFTLGHSNSMVGEVASLKSLASEWSILNDVDPIVPESFGIFAVEPRGICSRLVWQRDLVPNNLS